MLLLRQTVPTSDGNDVYQERWHHLVFLFCKVPEECSHLQERSAEAEVDNVLREEGTRLRKGWSLILARNGKCTIACN
jgi:hypothetical protein